MIENYPKSPIEVHMFLTRRAALKLEVAGLKHSRGSVYALCKREYGLRGSKQKVLDAMTEVRNELLGESK